MTPIDERLYMVFVSEGLPHVLANLCVAQSKHESANYTSRVFRIDNNINGYKYVKQKLATQGLRSPEGDHYAHYKSPEDSARELAGWIKRRVKEGKFPRDLTVIQTPAQYAHLLKMAGYYGDKEANYVRGLNRFYKDFNSVV